MSRNMIVIVSLCALAMASGRVHADATLSETAPPPGYDFAYFADLPGNDSGTFTITFEMDIVDEGTISGITLTGGGAGENFATYDYFNLSTTNEQFMFGFDFGEPGTNFISGGSASVTGDATPSSLNGPAAVPTPAALPAALALLGLMSARRRSVHLRA